MISGDRTLAAGKASAFGNMLEEFHTHFDRIDIICPRVQGAGPEVRRIHDNIHLHPSSGSLAMEPGFIRRKGEELFVAHRHGVATVHDYPPFYNGFGARLLKKRTGIPTVLELHHLIGWPHAASMKELLGKMASRAVLPSHIRHFDAVRVVNGSVKEVLVSWGVPEEKIHVVPSVYLDHTIVDETKAVKKQYDIVFCARLVENKGLLQTIDAVKLLPDATLLVIGDGPLRAKAEARARSLGSRVTFTGWLPSARDVLMALASGKVFVMNSKSEGNPRVAVEAMACEVPVVATKVGIMPDIMKDGVNGLFTTGKPKDLAAKIQSLLTDPSLLFLLGKEAAKVTERFEKESAIHAYADFLKSQVHSRS